MGKNGQPEYPQVTLDGKVIEKLKINVAGAIDAFFEAGPNEWEPLALVDGDRVMLDNVELEIRNYTVGNGKRTHQAKIVGRPLISSVDKSEDSGE